jgi:hypothetical protein
MEIRSANSSRFLYHVAIIVAILLSAQICLLYVKFLIAAHKQKRCESKNKPYGEHPQVFHSSYAKFQLSRFLGL